MARWLNDEIANVKINDGKMANKKITFGKMANQKIAHIIVIFMTASGKMANNNTNNCKI